MTANLVEIVFDLQRKMKPTTMSTLEKAFAVNDSTGTGQFEFGDFEAILGKVGLFCKRQDLTKLFNHFENKHYSEFLSALRGGVSPRREDMILKAWASLSGGAPAVPVAKFWDVFNPARHPRVLSGAQTPSQIGLEQRTILSRSGVPGTDDAQITKQHFIDMNVSASAADPHDDDLFCDILAGVWGVSEDGSSGMIPAAFLERVKNVLWEKVRQKTEPTAMESERLRLSLKQLDLEETGRLDYPTFLLGLEKFGVVLEEAVSRAFFAAHSGRQATLDIAAFSLAICSPSSKGSGSSGEVSF